MGVDEALAVCYGWTRANGEVDEGAADKCKQGAILQYVEASLGSVGGLDDEAAQGAPTSSPRVYMPVTSLWRTWQT